MRSALASEKIRTYGSRPSSKILKRKEEIFQSLSFVLVAGGGLEPPTFGLWARRAANCSIPRYIVYSMRIFRFCDCKDKTKKRFRQIFLPESYQSIRYNSNYQRKKIYISTSQVKRWIRLSAPVRQIPTATASFYPPESRGSPPRPRQDPAPPGRQLRVR